MHFTEPVYRNPYWPTWPLLEVTRGCTHNKCKFCTMYKGVKFGVPTPIIDSMIVLGGVMNHTNFFETGMKLEDLGIAHLDKEQLLAYLHDGTYE